MKFMIAQITRIYVLKSEHPSKFVTSVPCRDKIYHNGIIINKTRCIGLTLESRQTCRDEQL